MSETEIYPAPSLDWGAPPEDKWHREKKAFRRLLPTLLQTHKGQYVAIHEGEVVDTDSDLVALGRRVYRQFGYIPIYMDLVAEKPTIVRIPRYRIIGKA
jgi:hypothetical protein